MARDLRGAMVRFAAVLRRQGFQATPGHVTDAVRALAVLDLGDREELRLGLRSVFVTRPEEIPPFDRCFDAFWRAPSPDEEEAEGLTAERADAPEAESGGEPRSQKRETLALETWGEEEAEAEEPLDVPGVSDREALMGQDFSTFTADQLDEILRLTIMIARRLARRLSRRRRPVARRGRVDLRRTLRANLTRADLVELRYRQRKRKKVRLVLLCDVSGSMDLYSRFLLQFLFALQNVFGRVETFAFSTKLTRITEHLRGRAYRHVLAKLGEITDWSGGTRIGESLAQFNRQWAHLVDR